MRMWTDQVPGVGRRLRAGLRTAVLLAVSSTFALWTAAASAGTPGPGGAWATIDGSSYHSCGVKSDASAWCWGRNDHAQLGDGTRTDRLTPTRVSGGGAWAGVSTGLFHSCGVMTDGSAWCWGSNHFGELGDGTTGGGPVGRPRRVAGGGTWVSVRAAAAHTCGVRTDGSAWCWGYNSLDELGIGGAAPGKVGRPMRVAGGGTWASVSVGFQHTCGVRTDGSAWCWGVDEHGVLGAGDDKEASVRSRPVRVAGGGSWASVSAGDLHTCGVQTDGTAWCWGDNDLGQVGDGTSPPPPSHPGPTVYYRARPVRVAGGGTWASVLAGDDHSCGVRTDGSGWCWGVNGFGELGDGTTRDRLRPRRVAGAGTWSSVVPGGFQSCGVRTDRTALCWGSNDGGQLGDGTTQDRLRPRRLR